MLLGGLLLVEGARTGQHTAVLVGMGGALLLLSLLSDGALGAWPWIGRRLHRVLDFVAAAALAVSPLVLSLDAVLAIVILEAAALGMVWLAVRTNWTPADGKATPAPAVKPTAPPPRHRPRTRRTARRTARPQARRRRSARPATTAPGSSGRVVGKARNRLRDATASDTRCARAPRRRLLDPDGARSPPVAG